MSEQQQSTGTAQSGGGGAPHLLRGLSIMQESGLDGMLSDIVAVAAEHQPHQCLQFISEGLHQRSLATADFSAVPKELAEACDHAAMAVMHAVGVLKSSSALPLNELSKKKEYHDVQFSFSAQTCASLLLAHQSCEKNSAEHQLEEAGISLVYATHVLLSVVGVRGRKAVGTKLPPRFGALVTFLSLKTMMEGHNSSGGHNRKPLITNNWNPMDQKRWQEWQSDLHAVLQLRLRSAANSSKGAQPSRSAVPHQQYMEEFSKLIGPWAFDPPRHAVLQWVARGGGGSANHTIFFSTLCKALRFVGEATYMYQDIALPSVWEYKTGFGQLSLGGSSTNLASDQGLDGAKLHKEGDDIDEREKRKPQSPLACDDLLSSSTATSHRTTNSYDASLALQAQSVEIMKRLRALTPSNSSNDAEVKLEEILAALKSTKIESEAVEVLLDVTSCGVCWTLCQNDLVEKDGGHK